MKQYFVIGNPIDHSLSPKLHNHWFKINNIEAVYDKKRSDEKDLKSIINKIREKKINGINGFLIGLDNSEFIRFSDMDLGNIESEKNNDLEIVEKTFAVRSGAE